MATTSVREPVPLFLRYLVNEVTICERRLRDLEINYQLIPKKAVAELVAAKSELELWTVRRRVFIEVWEHISGDVWLTAGKRKQVTV